MLGSSQSISGPNIALNTMMAEELRLFADELEGASDFNSALAALIKRELTAHQRIIFNGNGYEPSWIQEAEARGLANHTCTADALPHFVDDDNEDMFIRHGVFTREELAARHEIHMEAYVKTLHIEAAIMADMVKKDIYPAATRSMRCLAETINAKRTALPDIDCTLEEALLKKVTALSRELFSACAALEKDLASAPMGEMEEQMRYYRYTVFDDMERTRAAADGLEMITPAAFWPYPSYRELLFSVR